MRLIDLGPLPLTLLASLLVAVILLGLRVFVMQWVQTQRQRENRQEAERLKSLVAAYRTLAGSFSPAEAGDRDQIESGLSDIILFGSVGQVDLAAGCVNDLLAGRTVNYQPLIDDLRATLRVQLGLDPIPVDIPIPASGPAPVRSDAGVGQRRGGRGGRAGGGGGLGGGTAVGLGTGLGTGASAGDATADAPGQDQR